MKTLDLAMATIGQIRKTLYHFVAISSLLPLITMVFSCNWSLFDVSLGKVNSGLKDAVFQSRPDITDALSCFLACHDDCRCLSFQVHVKDG